MSNTPAPGAPAPRVDVHVHYIPAEYRRAAEAAGLAHPDGMPGLPDWDVGAALAMMDGLNIRTAMLSLSSPGVHFGDDAAAAALARRVNEEGAAAGAAHPGRFGLFAALPLPDVDAAVREAAYAFDHLGADGVVVLTNQRGLYLGDPQLDPLMAELDRRRAVLCIHPTTPGCAGCGALAFGQPAPLVEFIFDTTRAVARMLYQRTFARFPNVRVIVPHAGGALPVLADRLASQAHLIHADPPVTPDEIFATLRGLYYDTAGAPLPRLVPATLSIADPARVLYGSDWPFTPLDAVTALAGALDATPLLDEGLRRRVLLDNALDLFPRLRA